MLTVRRTQILAMMAPQIERFRERACEHLRLYFPDQCALLSELELKDAIGFAFERAESYGFVSERDHLRYLTLMFVFGREFDRDPAFPWASQILSGGDSASEKTSKLQAEALRASSLGRGYRGNPRADL